jgi:hypothetical protein
MSYTLGGAVKNVHIEGGKDGVYLARSVLKFVCLTELIRNYADQDNGDLQCLLSGQGELGAIVDKKTLQKQLKQRAKGGGGRPDGAAGGRPGGDWKVTDVCAWLKKEGMGGYASSFQKNNIDGPALLALDENDLKDLGVAAVGDRSKLKKAIQDLNMHLGGGPPPQQQQQQQQQQGGGAQPVSTAGLVARNVNGQVKIFDLETGEEVHDIAEHQQRRNARLAAPPQQQQPPPQQYQQQPAQPAAAAGGGGGDHQGQLWYAPSLEKGAISGRLQGFPNGTFVVRDSASAPGSYGLSYIRDGKVEGKLIEPSGDGGFKLKGAPVNFPTLSTLMDNYVQNSSGALKCKLVYPTGGAAPVAAPAAPRADGMPHWSRMSDTKEQALSKIKGKPAGAFVIRPSDKAYAAISVIKPDGTSQFHQHIEETAQGLCLKKSSVHHADMTAFVAHYSSPSQGDLPCPLIENY